jgi:imidazoleglycerol phosphate dehydratase HisB
MQMEAAYSSETLVSLYQKTTIPIFIPYWNHILNTIHKYWSITDTMKVVKTEKRRASKHTTERPITMGQVHKQVII